MRSAGLGGGVGDGEEVEWKEGMVLENIPTLLANMFRFMHVVALQRQAVTRLLR
jgi:hypothetical protein